MGRPRHVSDCDPSARFFPPDWKDAWFRRNQARNIQNDPVYPCPICQREFSHHDLDTLAADHIWPYSLFGPTDWDNYRLLCGLCNSKRGDSIGRLVRMELGSATFKQLVITHLRSVVSIEIQGSDPFIKELLKT